MSDPAFETYLGKVEADYRRGIATESVQKVKEIEGGLDEMVGRLYA
jgi:hypothetical protein